MTAEDEEPPSVGVVATERMPATPAREVSPYLATDVDPRPQRALVPRADGPGDRAAREALRKQLFGKTRRAERVGRYEILDELGAGGMGVVLSARDPSLGRTVAIKLIRPREFQRRSADESLYRARLVREAQVMASFSHPNAVQVFEVGEHEGRVYLAMEHIEGQDLRRWLARERGWREVLDMFIQAGRGLAAAHAAGLVHRDFKPENVFVGDDGRARVGDFGLAYAMGAATQDILDAPDGPEAREAGARERETARLTETGALVGTPAYMAPEQFLGRQDCDQVDQFAFCVALWEGLCGERPFAGDSIAELSSAVVEGRRRVPPRGRRLPAWLWPILARGLAREPSERFPSMDALLETLERRRGDARLQREPGRARRNELLLLAKIREFWIDGVLERQPGAARLELARGERPELVELGAALQLARPEREEDAEEDGEEPSIAETFARRGRALLILGEPGAGKTTTLLELTRALLERAERDPDEPLPVVLNLASWRARDRSIETWIIDQLAALYRIPRALSRPWLADEALAVMLDGLDELAPAARVACARALNEFRDVHGLTPIAVTCRRREYEELGVRLKLDGAVQLRALDEPAIKRFLAAGGPQATGLREHLDQDPALRELARSPLMLSIMGTAFARDESSARDEARDDDDADDDAEVDVEERRLQVFDRYTKTMLERVRAHAVAPDRARQPAYTEAETLRWLAWLARVILQRGKGVFLLEQLQPRDLESRGATWVYAVATRLLAWVPLAAWLVWRSRDLGVWNATGAGALAVILALFVGRLLTREGAEPARARDARAARRVAAGLLVSVLLGFALLTALVPVDTRAWLSSNLAFALLLAAGAAYLMARRAPRLWRGHDVTPVETVGLHLRRLAVLAPLCALLPGALVWAALSKDDAAVVWDVETGARQTALTRADGAGYPMGWTPDGQHVLVLRYRGTQVIDVDTGALQEIPARLFPSSLDTESRRAVGYATTGSPRAPETRVSVWDTDRWERVSELELGARAGSVRGELRFGAGGRTLLVGHGTSPVGRSTADRYQADRYMLFETDSGRRLREFPPLCDRPHEGDGCLLDLRMSGDREHLLSQREDGVVELHGLAPFQRIASVSLDAITGSSGRAPALDSVVFLARDDALLVGAADGLWRIERDGARPRRIDPADAGWTNDARPWSLRLLQGGQRVLASRPPDPDAELSGRTLLLDTEGSLLAEHDAADAVVLTPARVAVGAAILDAEDGETLARLEGAQAPSLARASHDDDARRVVISDAEGAHEVWDLERGEAVMRTTHGGLAQLSPDGRRLLSFQYQQPALPIAIVVALFGLLAAFLLSLKPGISARKTRPNEGMQRALRRAPLAFAATVLLVLTGFAVYGFSQQLITLEGWRVTAAFALRYALGPATVVALALGGFAALCHGALRLLLAARGLAPLRMVPFLEHARERALLRRVGGGYIFVHRLLAEYFAEHAERRLLGDRRATPTSGRSASGTRPA